MTTRIDFTPLFRSSIGFDRVLNTLETASRLQVPENWPPYDIVKTGDDLYRIDMAVAGFADDDLELRQERNLLIVSGRKATPESENESYLYRGIAARSFERRFELADHVKVEGARLENGLLTVELRREIPEALKPRQIAITATGSRSGMNTPQISDTRVPEDVAA